MAANAHTSRIPLGNPWKTALAADRVLTRDSTCPELDVAVVIPTLNEAGSIGRVLDEIHDVMRGQQFKIVVVDGWSTDGSALIATRRGALVLRQPNNGYGDALKTGFLYSIDHLRAKIIVTIDADLSYDAKDIPQLVNPILEGKADLCIGNRFASACMQRGAMSLVNRLGNRLLSGFARLLLGIEVRDTQCGLRAIRSKLFHSLDLEAEGMPLATEMLSEATLACARVREIPVVYRKRVGVTKLNPITDGLAILATIIRARLRCWQRR